MERIETPISPAPPSPLHPSIQANVAAKTEQELRARPRRKRTGRKRTVFHVPHFFPAPVRQLWRSADKAEQQRAHQTCVSILEYWLGKKSKREVAAELSLPVLRVWQLSQAALSGMLAGLLKQPRARRGPVLGRGTGGQSEAAQKASFEAEDGAFPDGGLGAGLADCAVAAGKPGTGRGARFAPEAEGGQACSQESSQDSSQSGSKAVSAKHRSRANQQGGAGESASTPSRPSDRAVGASQLLSASDKARSRAALDGILEGAKRWLNCWG